MSFYDFGPDYDTASLWWARLQWWRDVRRLRRIEQQAFERRHLDGATAYTMAKYHRRRLEAQRPC